MGTRIGPYEVVQELGRGGMGVVYEVKDPQTPRTLALKLILSNLTGEGVALQRFGREAQVMAKVSHPNVIKIHHVGRAQEGPYLVTDMVRGESLKDVCRRGPVEPDRAAAIVTKVAEGVDALHAAGVLHRDLKPDNVILRPDHEGGPVILDLGIARDESAERLTQTGQYVGTPSYMSPEQADGDVHAHGPHTDVYGLGAVLVTLLSGRPPFTGSNALTILKAVLDSDPDLPSTHGVSVPPPLEAVCRKALAKTPSDRYPSARAFKEDLERFRSGDTPRAWLELGGSAGPPRWLLPLAALSLLLLIGLGAAIALRGDDPPQQEPPPPPTQDPAPTPEDSAREADDALAKLQGLEGQRRFDTASAWLAAHGDDPRAERIRSEELSLQKRLDYAAPLTRMRRDTIHLYARYLSAEELLVLESRSLSGAIYLTSPEDTSTKRGLVIQPGCILRFSAVQPDPDGWIAAGGYAYASGQVPAEPRDATLILVRRKPTDGAHETVVRTGWKASKQQITSLACSPDGRWLVVGFMTGRVLIFEWEALAREGEPAQELPEGVKETEVAGLAFDDRGRLAVLQTYSNLQAIRPNLRLFELQEGTWTQVASARTLQGSGTRLAVRHGHPQLVTAANWSYQVRTFDTTTDAFTDLRFVTEGARATKTLRDMVPWSSHNAAFRALAVSPDGRFAYSTSTENDIRVWDLDDGRLVGVRTDRRGYTYCLSLDPTGTRLLTCSLDDNAAWLEIWDVSPDQP